MYSVIKSKRFDVYSLFKGIVPTKNLPELKTVVSVSDDQRSRIVDTDRVNQIPPVSSQLKKIIEKHKRNQQYSNIILKNGQSINKKIVLKNKKLVVLKNRIVKPRKNVSGK